MVVMEAVMAAAAAAAVMAEATGAVATAAATVALAEACTHVRLERAVSSVQRVASGLAKRSVACMAGVRGQKRAPETRRYCRCQVR